MGADRDGLRYGDLREAPHEVFRARELAEVLDSADRFFALIPAVRAAEDDEGEAASADAAG
jgi:hypothetical protein